ncbi:MAG: hypothetical protein JW760_14875 [Spirochaetales bacterium]|nr:hypothetical protein [Spirochaetales bacterium]
MRDPGFVAEHRGGTLSIENHRKLIHWSRECVHHVLCLPAQPVDQRILKALETAGDWEEGRVPTGAAMKASVKAHAAAREAADPVASAVARAAGQAVATAHMADHSLGGALYALKAVKLAGASVDKEKAWQRELLGNLPEELVDLVLSTMEKKKDMFL